MGQVRGSAPELTDDASDAIEMAPAGAIGSVVVLCFGGLVASLMQTLIIPIQPDLPRLLGTSIGNASWIITATLLAAAVAMPIAGRLGDMFGKQRVLLVSAVLLTLGSLICALGDSLIPLIIGRGVQGLAMGFIPVGMSLIREITPPRITSMAVAAMSATLGVGGAIGLPLAAWIVQTWNWHALFYVAAGLGVLVTLAVLILVPRVNDAAGGRIDIPGAIGLAVGLSAFLIAVSKANDWGWTSGATLGLGIGGIVVLVGWGFVELRRSEPLVDLRTTARPAVLLTNIAAAAIGFGMMAQSIVLPMLLRLPEATGYGLGQSLLAAGLWMAPGGLMMMIFAPVSGILINRIGAKITLAIGAAILGCGYLLAFFLMDAAWKLMLASIVCAIGVGVGYAAMPTLIMGSVPATEAGAAVGLNGLMRSLGTTIASAVMALILASATISLGGTEVPDESTFTWCFLVAAAAAFVGMAITLTIPSRRGSSNVPEEQPLPARG
ncbi:MFS transporter [Gordonia terrae]|uniref:MFS transporter n=2 Tax=Gordonia terrae TaxID=2055 RepID=A0AAD0KA87_9ACTN|nr:MFS transporter permease [Gordonia terrae]AWO85820.1 MFS transporter [Gordonia terrae]GAB45392.1 putative major facilitator superfamily transporter [Gordonia terrae NBRC 100016]VTR07921.1 permease MDR type [Clostridioides difficile]VTS61565.1 Spectinomycin tetracycline efflux pump [Gordonia terrae]